MLARHREQMRRHKKRKSKCACGRDAARSKNSGHVCERCWKIEAEQEKHITRPIRYSIADQKYFDVFATPFKLYLKP